MCEREIGNYFCRIFPHLLPSRTLFIHNGVGSLWGMPRLLLLIMRPVAVACFIPPQVMPLNNAEGRGGYESKPGWGN